MPDLAAHALYTWDDFVDLDDDDRRELIDGELVEIEVPNRSHESIVMMLGYFLTAWARASDDGKVRGHALASGYKVRITQKRGVMPDVQFYRRENETAKGQPKGLVEGRPDLVVEIMSASSRRYDRVTKLEWYASRDVPEYWIVDPEARTLEQLLLADGAYVIAKSLAEDATFEPRTFPGLAIPLLDLWIDS